MRPYRFARPPSALRRAKLDNLAPVPASLLPFKAQWQPLANRMPQGGVLICLPSAPSPQRRVLQTVTALLQAKGRRVMTLPSERFG